MAALSLFILASIVWAGDSAPSTSTAPAAASTDDVRRAVRDLNHPAVSRRRAAIRQLAEWGPQVFPELRRAARERNLEGALSALDLLEELEAAIFLGARVRLSLSQTDIAWNEPLTLTVTAANPTSGPLRVPWSAPATRPASAPALADADQVAAMMDAADFLTVTGPNGKPVHLRVEPIERDPAVYAAVDQRARANPPSHQIEPGQEARLTIPLFNRGWARFPMLRKGTYRIEFSYQPTWKDESWTRDGFGQVTAAPLSVTVTQAAPDVLLRTDGPLELRLERNGQSMQAVLISRWDVPLWVNLNLGGSPASHARLDWHLVPLRQDDAESIELPASTTPPEFTLEQVRRIDPGDRLVAGSILISDIRNRWKEVSAERPGPCALQARYVQLTTTAQLRDELARLGKPHDVPTHLFTGAAISEELETAGLLKD